MSVAIIFDNVGLTGQLDMRIHQEASKIYTIPIQKLSKSRSNAEVFGTDVRLILHRVLGA